MEGKRFAIGLVAGLLVGLAVITASGGLGQASTPLASFGPIKNPVGGKVASSTATTSSSTVSQTRTDNLHGNLSALQSSLTHSTPAFSSQLASIAQQPLLSDTVIFVPVLLAVLLGAVLYRASLRDREDSGEG